MREDAISKLNIYADCSIAMAKGLIRSAKSPKRKDPPIQELFGPIREELTKVVEEKVRLLYANDRV